MLLAVPAPDSTTMSCLPLAAIFFTVSGVAATRVSPGRASRGMPISILSSLAIYLQFILAVTGRRERVAIVPQIVAAKRPSARRTARTTRHCPRLPHWGTSEQLPRGRDGQLAGDDGAKQGEANGTAPLASRATKPAPRQAPSLRVGATMRRLPRRPPRFVVRTTTFVVRLAFIRISRQRAPRGTCSEVPWR